MTRSIGNLSHVSNILHSFSKLIEGKHWGRFNQFSEFILSIIMIIILRSYKRVQRSARWSKHIFTTDRINRFEIMHKSNLNWLLFINVIFWWFDFFWSTILACNDTSCSTDKWFDRLENSNWLTLVLNSLNAACVVAQCLDQEGSPCLVHGGKGLDSTLIVTSLVQIILNPDCRTVRGWELLPEKKFYFTNFKNEKSIFSTEFKL